MDGRPAHSLRSVPRAVLWSAAAAAGIALGIAGLVLRPIRSWRRARPDVDTRLKSRENLQTAIIGSSKGSISRALGPPRATSGRAGEVASGATSYWQANVWYYPLAPREQAALAIYFDDDHAREVEIVPSPAAALRPR
jgi:hypothetical protein